MLIINPFYGEDISFDEVKRIERLALPAEIQLLQMADSWDEVYELFDLPDEDLIVVSDGESWFAIFIRHRQINDVVNFADFAKVPGSQKVDWGVLWDALREEGVRTVQAVLREHTSYKSFKRQEKAFRRRGVALRAERLLPVEEMFGFLPGERPRQVIIDLKP